MTELYDLKQLEVKLGISNRTLSRYLSEGTLTGIKVGREWRFTNEDIDEFLMRLRKRTEQAKKMHPGPEVIIIEKQKAP